MGQETIRVKVQKFGTFLSGMIMPNILAFIAWGILAALFIPAGWFPNEKFNELVGPTLNFLLPLLVGYTGGKQIYGTRGGVVAAMTTMGLIVGADVTMFLGAMIMGPLSAFIMKKIDNVIRKKVPTGFEMLIDNFSAGIFAAVIALLCLVSVGPIFAGLNNFLTTGVDFLVQHGLLPLISIFMEPAKVLFLNNAVNFGVLSPIGYDQVAEVGKSMMFAIDNPGVGLGILLSYSFFGKGAAKKTAPGAIIIHFFGGIAEIYFPYVLMNPLLLIATILGGMSGVLTLTLTNAGLIGPASPGSIFAFMAMTPKGNHFGVLLAIIVATVVTFVVASIIHKFTKSSEDEAVLEVAKEKTNRMKQAGKPNESSLINKTEVTSQLDTRRIEHIVFACDAGMGSSAMGASIVRNKINNTDLDLKVTNSAIRNLVDDETALVITQKELSNRAQDMAPSSQFFIVDQFLNTQQYDDLITSFKNS